MPQQPEKRFESSVNKHVGSAVHHEAMGTGFSAGTPDRWYDGPARDLWVEYKFYPTIPSNLDLTKKLTPLQQRWLNRASGNGRNVAVICGFPGGKGIILPDLSWHQTQTKNWLLSNFISVKEVAYWITEFTCTPSASTR